MKEKSADHLSSSHADSSQRDVVCPKGGDGKDLLKIQNRGRGGAIKGQGVIVPNILRRRNKRRDNLPGKGPTSSPMGEKAKSHL